MGADRLEANVTGAVGRFRPEIALRASRLADEVDRERTWSFASARRAALRSQTLLAYLSSRPE
jgi:hypothetical protein